MILFNRKDLKPDELVMLETAEAQAATPSRYVRELLRRLHDSRNHSWRTATRAAAKNDSASRVEFEIGDRVEVVRGFHKHKFGKVMEVDCGGTVYVKFDGTTLNAGVDRADLVKEPKFKTGDRVEVIHNQDPVHKMYGGKVGKVREDGCGTGLVAVSWGFAGPGVYLREEFLRPLPPMKFEVGDMVRVLDCGVFSRERWLGKLCTVQEVREFNLTVTDGAARLVVSNPADLELVRRFVAPVTAASKFTPGQRVRVTGDTSTWTGMTVWVKALLGELVVLENGDGEQTTLHHSRLEDASKFRVGDSVLVKRTGLSGRVEHIGPGGLDLAFDFGGGGCYQEYELEWVCKLSSNTKFGVGDVVTVRYGALIGKTGTVVETEDGYGYLRVSVVEHNGLPSLHHLHPTWLMPTPAPKKPLEAEAYCTDIRASSDVMSPVEATFSIVCSVNDPSPMISGELVLHAPQSEYARLQEAVGWRKGFKLRLEELPATFAASKPEPEPLPCPFCGGRAEVTGPSAVSVSYNARCATCQLGYTRDSKDKALAAWNRRAK